MAIAVADNRNPSYDGNITTANGFYRAEFGTLGCTYADSNITDGLQRAITFNNAGNFMGVMVFLKGGLTSTTPSRSITITLQENVAGTWTDRDSATLTAGEILLSYDYFMQFGNAGYLPTFKFSGGYAVDTTAGKWALKFNVGAGSNTWIMRYGASNQPSFIGWCDTQISFTSNQDQFVAADDIILDTAVHLKGALTTGDTVHSVAGWIGTGASRSVSDCCRLRWADSPASSYKVTCDGIIYMGALSGFRAGSDASPIPASAMGHLEFQNAAVGTNHNAVASGFRSYNHQLVSSSGFFLLYGEVPAYEDTLLEADAATGQPVIVTKDVTGWVAGDQLAIGGCDTYGDVDMNLFTISSVAGDGKTITLTTNLGNKRWAGRPVIRLNGYGFKMTATNTNGLLHVFYCPLRWVMRGVEVTNVNFQTYQTAAILNEAGWSITHCSCYHTFNYAVNPTSGVYWAAYSNFYGGASAITPNRPFLEFKHNNCFRCVGIGSMYVGNGAGVSYIDDNISINQSRPTVSACTMNGRYTFNRNFFDGSSTTFVVLNGYNAQIRDNSFWGMSGGGSSQLGAMKFGGLQVTSDMGGNKFNNCSVAYNISTTGTQMSIKTSGDEFGQVKANSTDIYFVVGALAQIEFENFKGNATVYWWSYAIGGSVVRLTKGNQVEGNDYIITEEGSFYKCGDGLSDTTNHTETYSLKFVPRSHIGSTVPLQDVLKWEQKIPTENIQNQSMAIGAWVKLASTNYANIPPEKTMWFDGNMSYVSTNLSTPAYTNATVEFDIKTVDTLFMGFAGNDSRYLFAVSAETSSVSGNTGTPVFYVDDAIVVGTGTAGAVTRLDLQRLVTDGSWHHVRITGVNFSAWAKINIGGNYGTTPVATWNINGTIANVTIDANSDGTITHRWNGYGSSAYDWTDSGTAANDATPYYGTDYAPTRTMQMPRLTVNYDNGTLAYKDALLTTDWQFVSVPFTPLTTYGELTVSVSGQSQAPAAKAAFYVAEMSVLYPAGHNIAMGKMNTWSSSLPTMPSISTTISAGDVWAVDPSQFGASTVGDKVNKIKTDTGLIPSLL